MNGSQLITMFNNLVEDSLDETLAYQLLNNAKNKLESERPWEMLKKKDTSLTATAANTYTTEYSLPTDFYEMDSVFVDTTQYASLNFEQQIDFKDTGNYYFIDHRTNKLHLCGTLGSSKSVYLFYLYATDDVKSDTSPIWPARFHPLIAFEMAILFTEGIDADEASKIMSPGFLRAYADLKNQMIGWDARLKYTAMNGRTGATSYLSNDPTIIHDPLL